MNVLLGNVEISKKDGRNLQAHTRSASGWQADRAEQMLHVHSVYGLHKTAPSPQADLLALIALKGDFEAVFVFAALELRAGGCTCATSLHMLGKAAGVDEEWLQAPRQTRVGVHRLRGCR